MPAQNDSITSRLNFAKSLAREAGDLAMTYFRSIGELEIRSKGVQDMVSDADLNVETFVREKLALQFPHDGIVGEEHADA